MEDGDIKLAIIRLNTLQARLKVLHSRLVSHIGIKKAIGTSAAIGLPISVAGTIGYLINGWGNNLEVSYSVGFVYLPAVFLISLTSFVTAPYGAKLAQHLPVKVLKRIFACLLLLLSFKMLVYITYIPHI